MFSLDAIIMKPQTANAADAAEDEDYYPMTLREMRREEEAREEVWNASAQNLLKRGWLFDTENLNVGQTLTVLAVVGAHLNNLRNALLTPVGTLEECSMVQVFHIYNELKSIAVENN